MNDFDTRWRQLTGLARHSTPRPEDAPFGFASRVAASALRPPAEGTWDQLLPRFLAAATLALVLCTAVEWRHLRAPHRLDPGIENSIAQLVWSL